jgi:hypothetical protein
MYLKIENKFIDNNSSIIQYKRISDLYNQNFLFLNKFIKFKK